jgi:transcriptional regulator
MYVPPAFANERVDELHDFIEQHSFGLLVSTLERRLFATHLPFLLDRGSGVRGTLVGHFAKANPQWTELASQDVLVVFSGPHAYISPTWYEAENTVPTWNYVAVHAYGRCEVIDDAQGITRILQETVDQYERGRPPAWRIDANTQFFERLSQMVVGFRIEIERLEGKWKLNQNHPEERRRKVVDALLLANQPDSTAIAKLMADTLTRG